MKLNKLIVAAAISIFCSNLCTAQKSLDLEDVLSGKLIRTKGVGAMNWMKDGERYSRLEPNTDDLVLHFPRRSFLAEILAQFRTCQNHFVYKEISLKYKRY